jgi:hypothetical protein
VTLSGHIENGKIVLDESVPLVEGTKVRIELVPESSDDVTATNGDSKPSTLSERWKPLFGMIKDGPTDFAENLDHYLYGIPKQ